jgi:hypothetical protein
MKSIAPGVKSEDTKAVMNRAIALLLNNEVSEQTRDILNKQLKEGVPVKGELGEVDSSMRAADQGDTMMADQQPRPALQGRRRQEVFGQQIPPPVAMSASDLEIAKVFGLVLGSPEFQRR